MNSNYIAPTSKAREASRYVAVRGKLEHLNHSMEAISNTGMEPIGGDEWELFTVSLQDDKYVWGAPVEGVGLINVCVPLKNVRELTNSEKAFYSKAVFGMYGSHSGNLSYNFTLGDLNDSE